MKNNRQALPALVAAVSLVSLLTLALSVASPASARAQDRGLKEIYNNLSEALVSVQFVARIPVARFGQMQDVERQVSGVIVTPGGLVLVTDSGLSGGLLGVGELADPQNLTVKFADGKSMPARFVGADEDSLLAFIQIEPQGGRDNERNFAHVEFVERDLSLGEEILSVVDLPESYKPNREMGFSRVSAAIERPNRFYMLADSLIGFTGSPAATRDGAVVGLLGQDPTAASLGGGSDLSQLAAAASPVIIPSARILPSIENPPQTAEQEKGFIGIQMQALNAELADLWGIPKGGVIVSSLVPGSPAIDAGVIDGDIITHLNGMRVDVREDEELIIFQHAVRRHAPGESIELTILRAEKEPDPSAEFEEKTVAVTLTDAPVRPSAAKTYEAEKMGLTVRELTLTDRLSRQLEDDAQGVIVTLVVPAGPASLGGLQSGDLIMQADGEAIVDVAAFEAYVKALHEEQPKETVLFVQRGTETAFIHVKLDW